MQTALSVVYVCLVAAAGLSGSPDKQYDSNRNSQHIIDAVNTTLVHVKNIWKVVK